MKKFDYIVWKEGEYYVSQCVGSNISSFGNTLEEAVDALKESLELYYEDEEYEHMEFEQIIIGRGLINA